jgi:hypothetical protein
VRAVSAQEEFTKALQEFVDAKDLLERWIRGRVPGYIESQVGTLGRDVHSAVEWLYLSGALAVAAVEQYSRQVRQGADILPPSDSTRQAVSAIKAFYWFLRAYHDAIYRVIVALGGSRPGDEATMARGLAEQSPVREMLDRQLPTYPAEFLAMRERRNRVKRGTGHGSMISSGEVSIHFSSISDDGMEMEIVEEVNRSTIIGDLRMTTRLVEAVNAEYA